MVSGIQIEHNPQHHKNNRADNSGAPEQLLFFLDAQIEQDRSYPVGRVKDKKKQKQQFQNLGIVQGSKTFHGFRSEMLAQTETRKKFKAQQHNQQHPADPVKNPYKHFIASFRYGPARSMFFQQNVDIIEFEKDK